MTHGNLLDLRNHYLEKFLGLNRTQLLNGIFELSELDEFYQTREKILEILNYLQDKIAALDPISFGADSVAKNVAKEKLVKEILDQDKKILAQIEHHKIQVNKELQAVTQQRKGISGYKLKSTSHRLSEIA